MLRAVDLKVFGREPERNVGAFALHGVHHGLFQVQQERVAKLIGFRLVGPVALGAPALQVMIAEAVFLQLVEDVPQGLLADLA